MAVLIADLLTALTDFSGVVNASISAGWLILVILLLRLLLKKVPKWIHVALWGLVALRLVMPFSPESSLSLIPSPQTISSELLQAGPIPGAQPAYLEIVTNPVLGSPVTVELDRTIGSFQWDLLSMNFIWLIGAALMIVYALAGYLLLYRSVRTAVRLRDNIFQCETVRSPFVLGILRPRIFLSFRPDGQAYVIAHEQAHIHRRDHWWKPLGFLLLAMHWFNPLMWLAYLLFCRDLELACDEKVICSMENEQRADYTQALVNCSIRRRSIAACPLAFGEVSVIQRVRSVMHYRKPAFRIVVLGVAVCLIAAVCFLTDPAAAREFRLEGGNIANLNPERIIEKIAKAEKPDNSPMLYVNAENHDLMLTSDFQWANDGAISFFYYKNQKTYGAQLRIFTEENRYFITDSTEWIEQERIFLLRHLLDALKYLPQSEIRSLSPDADRYCVSQTDFGAPADFERVVTYSPEGVTALDGWFIHLTVQPLRETEGAYNGVGEEIIHLFYGYRELLDRESGTLVCYAKSGETVSRIEPNHYADGFDWDYGRLPGTEMNGSGKLLFSVGWDTDSLIVGEDYYEKTGPDSTMIHQQTHTLRRNAEGLFELDIRYKNPGKEESAVYFIQGSSGKYVMKILFREADAAPTADGSAGYYLTVGTAGVRYVEVSTPSESGGCENADGSLFRKGERIRLTALDGYTDLRGVTVRALGEQGQILWSAAVPDDDDHRGFVHLLQGDWILSGPG